MNEKLPQREHSKIREFTKDPRKGAAAYLKKTQVKTVRGKN